MVTDYVVNSHLKVEARDDYWGKAPGIKNIEFYVINEDAQVINALDTGEIDLASIPLSEIEYVESLGYDVVIANVANDVTLFSMPERRSKEARCRLPSLTARPLLTSSTKASPQSLTTRVPTTWQILSPASSICTKHIPLAIILKRARELAEQVAGTDDPHYYKRLFESSHNGGNDSGQPA